jgi:aromatic-amino-acid transaminase
MFCTLPLSPEQVRILRDEHGVYMAGSGRISLPGLTPDRLAPFVAALAAVR